MDKRAELLLQVQKEFKFDKMIVIGVQDDAEQLHFMTTADLHDTEAMLLLLDAMADLTMSGHTPEIIH